MSTYQYILACTIFSITYQYVLGTDRYIPVCTKNPDFVQPVTIPDAVMPVQPAPTDPSGIKRGFGVWEFRQIFMKRKRQKNQVVDCFILLLIQHFTGECCSCFWQLFEDKEDTKRAPDAGTADAAAATPATLPDGRSCRIRREGASTTLQPWGQEPGLGQQGAGGSC